MRSAAYHLSIRTARGDALFVSALQGSDQPSEAQVRQAIATAIRAFGAQGCAARVAQAYGEHPETAVLRMRWARVAVTDAFDSARPKPASACPPDRLEAGDERRPAGTTPLPSACAV
jgi:hypothetical protein